MAVSYPKRRPKSGCWAMRVKWTEPALEDLAGIQAYIAKDSPYYAKQFIERIFEAAEALEDFPELGRKVPEAEATENITDIDLPKLPDYVPQPKQPRSHPGRDPRQPGLDEHGTEALGGGVRVSYHIRWVIPPLKS